MGTGYAALAPFGGIWHRIAWMPSGINPKERMKENEKIRGYLSQRGSETLDGRSAFQPDLPGAGRTIPHAGGSGAGGRAAVPGGMESFCLLNQIGENFEPSSPRTALFLGIRPSRIKIFRRLPFSLVLAGGGCYNEADGEPSLQYGICCRVPRQNGAQSWENILSAISQPSLWTA